MGQTAKDDTAIVVARLDVVSDAICPWCYVGKRQLDRALVLLEPERLGFSVHWRAFQLNPDMPMEGVERRSYRLAKFGSLERSAELDAGVAEAGRRVGITFRHDLMVRTPNTLDAHRLIRFAETVAAQDAVVDRLFAAYFTEGRDIGDRAVLADVAAEAGLDRAAVAAMLAGEDQRAEVLAEEQAARARRRERRPQLLHRRPLPALRRRSGREPCRGVASGGGIAAQPKSRLIHRGVKFSDAAFPTGVLHLFAKMDRMSHSKRPVRSAPAGGESRPLRPCASWRASADPAAVSRRRRRVQPADEGQGR